MPLPPHLGRYRVEKEIGQGAMGRVFLGHDPAIDRRVALKTIHLPGGLAPEQRQEAEARFLREVRAAGRLSHPHIVTIFDAGQDAVFGHFVAMEYVEGPTLESLVSSSRLPSPRTVASVACQAADALAYAHRQGIVHRDIKPANLILVDGRTVKITDFGLAKPEGAALTHDGSVLGTPYYMSPEQVKGAAVDGRSDLFSLAVVVYELLTGKRPFRGDSVSTVLYRITHEPPVAPDPERVAAAEPVKAFLAKALAKDPERRYPDGDAFARALREAFAALPAEATAVQKEAQGPPPGTPPAMVPPATPPGMRPEGAGKASESRTRSPRPARAVKPASASQAGRRKPTTVAAGARRRRRGPSLLPWMVGFIMLVAVAWLYRDALFEWGAAKFGLSLPAATEPSPSQPTGSEQAPPMSGPLRADELEVETDTGPPAGSPPAGEAQVSPPEPESAPRPAQSAAVRLRSEPPGAVFTLDGRPLEGTVVPAPVGAETVVVQASRGCLSASRELRAADAGAELVLVLEPMSRVIAVRSTPEGAGLTVDGEKRGTTPAEVTLDACRAHELKLARAEFEPLTIVLDLKDEVLEAPERLNLELRPLPRGTVLAPTPPYPVVMELAGRRMRPGEKISLVADIYRFKVSSTDLLLQQEVRVRVAPDRETTPDVDFPPLARFNVLAAPSNVELSIGSEAGRHDLGAPPVIDAQVVAGTYTVRCTFRHNGEQQEKTVTLRAGDNPPIRFVAGQPGGNP